MLGFKLDIFYVKLNTINVHVSTNDLPPGGRGSVPPQYVVHIQVPTEAQALGVRLAR